MTGLKDIALLIGRLLLALTFVHEGFTLATDFSAEAETMAKLGISTPMMLTVVALQICAGISLVFGILARLGAVALGLFCVATALMFHTNFQIQNELLHFEKDLGLAGGMFVLAAAGAGALSVDRFLEPYLASLFSRRA